MAETTTLPTIWRVPDELWEPIHALINQYDPPCKTGRKRIDARLALNGIIYRARTGCQWNQLPPEFGDDASIHRTLQRWEKLDLFGKLWAVLLQPLRVPGRRRVGLAICRWVFEQSARCA